MTDVRRSRRLRPPSPGGRGRGRVGRRGVRGPGDLRGGPRRPPPSPPLGCAGPRRRPGPRGGPRRAPGPRPHRRRADRWPGRRHPVAGRGAAGRPDVVVLVDRDGRLVALDLATGEDRVLYDDVSAPPTRGDFIGGIDVSPDGRVGVLHRADRHGRPDGLPGADGGRGTGGRRVRRRRAGEPRRALAGAVERGGRHGRPRRRQRRSGWRWAGGVDEPPGRRVRRNDVADAVVAGQPLARATRSSRATPAPWPWSSPCAPEAARSPSASPSPSPTRRSRASPRG